MAFFLLVFLVLTLIRVRQIHRRGQTVSESWAAGLAERRLRADRRERARHAAAALPWLNDKRLSPADQSGVLITPAPDPPEYFRSGYDIVLDSSGDLKIQVITQVRKLTRLPLKDAMDLVDAALVTVLRMPDQLMACAAKSVLESAGATVSITDPGS